MDYLEQAQQYISDQKHGFEYFALVLGILFAWSAIGNWNWFYDPPYSSVKNPIGFWFGRKAFGVTIKLVVKSKSDKTKKSTSISKAIDCLKSDEQIRTLGKKEQDLLKRLTEK